MSVGGCSQWPRPALEVGDILPWRAWGNRMVADAIRQNDSPLGRRGDYRSFVGISLSCIAFGVAIWIPDESRFPFILPFVLSFVLPSSPTFSAEGTGIAQGGSVLGARSTPWDTCLAVDPYRSAICADPTTTMRKFLCVPWKRRERSRARSEIDPTEGRKAHSAMIPRVKSDLAIGSSTRSAPVPAVSHGQEPGST